MIKYTIKRILLVFLTAFIILSLTFILMKMLPVQAPAGNVNTQKSFYDNQVFLGYAYVPKASEYNSSGVIFLSVGSKKYAYKYYPILTQYWSWLKNIITKWDWGTSTNIKTGASAMSIIASKLPYSVKINIWATLIDIPIGFGLGIWAAIKKNKLTDTIISTIVMIFISVPSFVTISLLISWLSYGANALPNVWPPDSSPLGQRVLGYIIPVSTLAAYSIASFTRYARAEISEVMSSEFMVLARTKGLTKGQAIVRHALRNSGVILIPMVIGEFVSVLGGSMITEQLYSIPGIGQLFVEAISVKDYNVVMVDMAMYTMIGLLANLLVDLSYGFIDPRIRMGAKK